ncbi:TetR/AcrR family transcriptional regulator [Nonomuraea sp. LPB2021202275-12-8]|uniref:TetR/AcrR family transcriptional regulator n=1 Tax=Nonomuraea sp. LPB2021202275-12-8 TaxID=3120159 RepID=UPI00300CDD5B
MSSTTYRQAQQEGQVVVRAAILDTATHLLINEGPAALTVRRISGEAGCSTKVIYTLFGGKEGLTEALWLEGFARFEQRLLAVPFDPDALTELRAGIETYRDYALEQPAYYRVMFQGAVPGFTPSRPAQEVARRTFSLLVAVVSRCLEEGRLRGATDVEIADVLWMAMHGAVSLELSGYFDRAEAERRYRLLCSSVLKPFLTPDERTT